MAMNISDRKRRARILESDCANWRGNTLAVQCASCGTGRLFLIGKLPARPGETLGSLIGRLHCAGAGCRRGDKHVSLFSLKQSGPMRVAIVLWGEGAAG